MLHPLNNLYIAVMFWVDCESVRGSILSESQRVIGPPKAPNGIPKTNTVFKRGIAQTMQLRMRGSRFCVFLFLFVLACGSTSWNLAQCVLFLQCFKFSDRRSDRVACYKAFLLWSLCPTSSCTSSRDVNATKKTMWPKLWTNWHFACFRFLSSK